MLWRSMAMFPALLSARRYPLNYAAKGGGAEGIRTPDLRRAKAARHFAESFWSLQKSCKTFILTSMLFPSFQVIYSGCCTVAAPSCRSLGLQVMGGLFTIS